MRFFGATRISNLENDYAELMEEEYLEKLNKTDKRNQKLRQINTLIDYSKSNLRFNSQDQIKNGQKGFQKNVP